MEQASEQVASMTRYVLVAGFTMACLTMLSVGLAIADVETPNSVARLYTLIAIFAALELYRRRINRPMRTGEMLWFASGVTLASLVVQAIFMVIGLLAVDLPLNMQSVDSLWGGGKGHLLEPAFLALLIFITGLDFLQAWFFAWLLTRKLPRG